MGRGWAGFGSVKIQNLICLQNWAVCGALLVYFPQLCYHLSHVCFRHNLRQTAACLSCSTQTHIDTASAEESRATFLDAKSSRGLWALQQSIWGYLKTTPSFLRPSAVMEYFWKLGFSQPAVFLLPLTFISQVLTNQYMFHNHQVEIQKPWKGFIGYCLTDSTLQSLNTDLVFDDRNLFLKNSLTYRCSYLGLLIFITTAMNNSSEWLPLLL